MRNNEKAIIVTSLMFVGTLIYDVVRVEIETRKINKKNEEEADPELERIRKDTIAQIEKIKEEKVAEIERMYRAASIVMQKINNGDYVDTGVSQVINDFKFFEVIETNFETED